MNIMIDHAVPLNNGDAALIFALGDELERLGNQVTYSTFQLEEAGKRYPNRKWVASILSIKWLNRLPGIRYLYYCLRILSSSTIQQQDIIIAAPGGYINSYYGFSAKLLVLSLYQRLLGIPIVMGPQSVGPLNPSDEVVLQKYLPYFSAFLVRDRISHQRIQALATNKLKVIRTYDAAFLTEPLGYQSKEPSKLVAISVRAWTFDNRQSSIYQQLIVNIVEELVFNDYHVVFLSTCQGTKGYIDDSVEAKKIYQILPEEIKNSVSIDAHSYDLEQLKDVLQVFDYVIGTRLHMCILSWLSGVPAFNISYEEKGKECYDYLGLAQYTIDYNDNKSDKKLAAFLTMSEEEQLRHFHQIDHIHQQMSQLMKEVLSDVS